MNRRIHPQLVRSAIWAIGGIFLLLLSILIFGHVHGQEFAPDTFARRHYSYYELPLVHLQVWPVAHMPRKDPLQRVIQNKKYIPYSNSPKRWDLVYGYRGGSRFTSGPADVLCRYLDAVDSDDKFYWLNWTNDHPKLASVFWPEIADLARRNHYCFMPDLFDTASCAKNPVLFRAELKRTLSEKYEALAGIQVKLNKYHSADKLYSKALKYQPDRPGSLAGRAVCRQRLKEKNENR